MSECDNSTCNPSNCDSNSCALPTVSEEVTNDSNTESSETDKSSLKNVNLLEVEIDSTNTALNVMVGFLGLAQKRGCFAINESAKIYECIEKFT